MTDWIAHTGNECPVDGETMVECLYDDGSYHEKGHGVLAKCAGWGNGLTHYRLVEPAAVDKTEPVKSLRDEMAMAALTGLLAAYANPATSSLPYAQTDFDNLSKYAYGYAEAMMNARTNTEKD